MTQVEVQSRRCTALTTTTRNPRGWITCGCMDQGFWVGRRERVCVLGSYSYWAAVTIGVPHGSVLGPLLFVVFIIDLPDVVSSLCQLYADDAKVFFSEAKEEYVDTLQEDLDTTLADWADTWQLRFNVNKCKVIHMGQRNPGYTYTDMKTHGTWGRVVLGTSDTGTLKSSWWTVN